MPSSIVPLSDQDQAKQPRRDGVALVVQLTEDWIDPKAQEWVQDLSLEAGSEVLLCELWNEPEEFAGLAPTAWVRVHHERCTCQDEPLVDSADEDCNCSD
eukprot:CAMPEP_0181311888 /NCGR_PEP_ID=MMETSP1101-20121128/13393_1 /TAXON_ID=46948 /ORGANISM="Rhodomonas abbreviata, Strain Caron Lab Isolate" /LENGTH=99 /DNA_ID=CAMNT_0023418681 /DNA_START=291 /DNA_END=591 /DNA_ORIENTATION=-